MAEKTLQGALTFLGFAIAILGVLYFSFEFIPEVSEWTQLAALILLALTYAFLGVWIKETVVGGPFFEGDKLQWLRPAVVMYLLALGTGIAATVRFLTIPDVDRNLKVLITIVVGVGIIVFVAMTMKKKDGEE